MTQFTIPVRCLVLVCTYNERTNLPRLTDEISKAVPHADILVIDDGSPDGTGDWALEEATRRPAFKIIQRGAKLGLGSAIKTGLQYAIDKDYELAINLDADFSHDPTQIPQLIEVAIEQPVSLVIGSRYIAEGGLRNCSWRRHLVSRAANFYARRIVGWKVYDCSSAFRCYRVEALRKLDFSKLHCSGYGFLEEILWWLLQSEGDVTETPIIYTERERGDSKISIREAFGTLQVLNRLALARFTSK